MARSRSIGGIFASLSLRDGAFTRGLVRARRSMNAFGKSVATAGAGAAVAGAALVVAGLTKAVNAAAEMEGLETAFQPLLGSAAAAEERIRELSKFAAATPFELPEIAKASMVLETLTRGALSTGKGLEMVGDIASAVNRPFDEVAVSVGRLYDGLMSGRPVGEAMARMQELGVISGETRGQIEALQKEGKKGADVWGIAEAAMGRFSGSMELQSRTWNGRMSTLKDNINLAFAAMGKPIMLMLGPELDKLANYDFTTLGENLGAAIATGIEMLLNGTAWEMFALHAEKAMATIVASLSDSGIHEAINGWAASFNAIFDGITAKYGDGYNFGESFDKYAEAGNAVADAQMQKRIAKIDELEQRIAEIQKKAAEGFQQKRTAAADAKAGQKPPEIAIPINLPVAAGPAKAAFEADAYQRRGLSLDSSGGGSSNEAKQTTLMADIKDLLARIAKTREPLAW